MIPFLLNISAGQYDIGDYVGLARRAEEAGLDAIVLPDLPLDSAEEPTTVLAHLAAVTHHLGLIAGFPAAYNDPLELARRLADLDFISGGRVGWLVTSDQNPATARRFGARAVPIPGELSRQENEVVDWVLARWDERTDLRSPQGRPVLIGSARADLTLIEGGRDELARARSRAIALLQVTTERSAEELAQLVQSGAADGFSIVPDDLDRFFDQLVPDLHRRGLLAAGYETSTLRGHLGLSIPEPAAPASVLAGAW